MTCSPSSVVCCRSGHVRNRRNRGAPRRGEPGSAEADERGDGAPRPGRRRGVGIARRARTAQGRCSRSAGSPSSTSRRRGTSRWWTPPPGTSLLFNGEVYNFRALREQLAAEGHTFASTGDAAVVLRALATRGPDALPTFRGMFALACWDPRRRTLLLGEGSAGHQAALRGPPDRPRRRVDPGLRLRGTGAARLGPPRHAAPRPRGRRLGGVERLRRRTGHRSARHRVAPPRRAAHPRRRRGGARRRTLLDPPRPGEGEPLDEDALAAALEESVRLHLVSDGRWASSSPAGSTPRGRQPRPEGEPGAGPHLHPRLRGGGIQRGASPRADRPGDRHRAPGGDAHRGAFVARARSRASTASTSRPSTA